MRTCLFSALLFLVAASPATAADPYRTPIAAIIDTTGSHGDQALTSVALDSGIHLVTVTCYYWAASGSICAGGGDFDDGGTCDVGSDNGATIIRNSHSSHCWYRKNFGLNGVVDARQCGVHGDGVTDDYVPLNTCLGLAGSLGIPVVNTGGGVILDNTDDIVPPSNVTLTCGGNNQGSAADDDYRILNSMGHLQLTNAIVLDPTFIKSDHTGLRIGLSQFNSGLEGCNLEAGAGTPVSGVYPNPYSPSRWFPKCPPGDTSCSSPGSPSLRSAIQEADSFNPSATATYSGGGPASAAAAIYITGEHNTVRKVTALGFGRCYATDVGAKRIVIEDLIGDCHTGPDIQHLSSGGEINGFNIGPFLTRSNGSASISARRWTI